MHRLFALVGALAAAFAGTALSSAGQDLTARAVPEGLHIGRTTLAFSEDGRILREMQSLEAVAQGEPTHVRAVSYDVTTGKILHTVDFGAGTRLLSLTTDGRAAIISVDSGKEGTRPRLLWADVGTGRAEEVPSQWFAAGDKNPWAQISGDGRLVSAYSEEGPQEAPRVVGVYDWETKQLIAKRGAKFSAGGSDSGGVTEDGKIEFSNNRTGSNIVDPKTGRDLVSYGPLSVRSPNGAWVVDFPNEGWGPDVNEVPIKNGMNGQTVGKLDIELTGEETNWWWQGAFCGASGRFVAAGPGEVLVFEIPSGKRLESLAPETWRDPREKQETSSTVACSADGKLAAIGSGQRLTLHHLN